MNRGRPARRLSRATAALAISIAIWIAISAAPTLGAGRGEAPASAPDRAAGETARLDDLSVMTYNVKGIVVPVLRTPFATRKGRFTRIGPKLSHADVVLLQEFFGVHARRRDRYQRHLLENATQTDQRVALGPIGRFYDSGLGALLSSPAPSPPLEPADYEPVNYKHCYGQLLHGSDCFSKKGFFFVRLDHGGQAIDVFTTHLDSADGSKDRAVRQSQLEELEARLRESIDNDVPVIVAGDFNTRLGDGCRAGTDYEEPDVQSLCRLLNDLDLEDACFNDRCNSTSCQGWPMCDEERIDYVFFRSSRQTRLVFESAKWDPVIDHSHRLSDHPALFVNLEVWRSQAPASR